MKTVAATTSYIEHNRHLGKRFNTEEAVLTAFSRSLGDVSLGRIRPVMISRFLDREGTSDATVSRKRRVLAGFFRFAVSRHLLHLASRCVRKGRPSSCTPHIYSEAELKRLLTAVPPATGRRSDIDATTLRMALLLLFGAGAAERRCVSSSRTSMGRNLSSIFVERSSSRPASFQSVRASTRRCRRS